MVSDFLLKCHFWARKDGHVWRLELRDTLLQTCYLELERALTFSTSLCLSLFSCTLAVCRSLQFGVVWFGLEDFKIITVGKYVVKLDIELKIP